MLRIHLIHLMKLHLLFLPITLLCFSFGLTAQSTAISDCGLFADGPNDTWPHALTVTTPDSGNSSDQQVININVTMLPSGGANYRVVKTVANGNWNNGNAMMLSMGMNTITVTAVSFDRTVKLQFSDGSIEFDVLSINGEAQVCPGATDTGTPVAQCSLFADGPNGTWPHALTVTTPDSGNSSAEQVIEFNVTSLPAGGADYRIVKTVANGNWNNGNAMALTLGMNTITVSEVTFDRSVKLQLSSGEVEFDSLVINGSTQECDTYSGEGTAIAGCSLFDEGPNETWPHALSVTTPDSGTSSAEQVVVLNITSLPAGSQYRIVKTVANGNWDTGSAQALVLGLNTITVAAVTFDRSVKLQFDDGDVEFNALTINGTALECAGAEAGGTPVADCLLFADGPNATWPYAMTVTTPDSADSGAEQVIDINVTLLPAEGAEYRIVKTVANGNWFNGNPFALQYGMNTITVSAVAFTRSVKLQISSGEVEFDGLSVNGTALTCPVPCADVDEDGICDVEDDCVGEYDALGVCNGNCAADADGDGVCDNVDNCVGVFDECGVCNGGGILPGACDCEGNFEDALGECGGLCPSDINNNGICDTEESGAYIYCGEGTVWNPLTLECEESSSCPTDLDGDGTTAVGDLLVILGAFGQSCD